ncbi:MAG: tRNA pseudouridine(55) synthase TruB [Gammaproteobacteria bacterium]|uniref:tRNA pseudouridine(55) synthase TruB n=1 Tax=Marinomonas sp. ef1 TaxID=2005043 RepID=UPI000C291858|nr:tRNA pseudouridine(55) synthase TruB [Marinomonas sp. ef1]MBU1293647.1 tRNA pseudouridine(55) synthase TruB [Gammaproteobacteria bacterium]MBU1465029.1 tRNA pseudouridine(55) synthase TruB [Gammaproteobacteria bacterium]MBU2022237.1 tRNA pseudouridine(55) synthase TruB [Gammaproteobacteria bacterium]MBU2240283.1 tRNA pseudouridine(55) synthase TruB [Gammaproteobacteria bacterium]MBU2317548.1 tRNA pseudouridine(55) synthase TruB [Gammaproteobacteria bacterium]
MVKAKWRSVDGIVLLNKPIGLSSNQALQRVRRLYQAAKAGHTGALDPLATGMLPLCLGEATKFSQYLLDANKRYLTCIQLGKRTTTGDREGEVLTEELIPTLTDESLEEILDGFRGEIEQIPPMYSALKHEGRPLYEYARQGIVIERKRRRVTISNLTLVSRTEDTLTLDIQCSKGTYIRTIGEDIGEALGCGAHLHFLHRISTAGYLPENMMTLEQFEAIAEQGYEALDSHLISMDTAVEHFTRVNLPEADTLDMLFGRTIPSPVSLEHETVVRMYDHGSQRFLGLGQIKETSIRPYRLVNTSEFSL